MGPSSSSGPGPSPPEPLPRSAPPRSIGYWLLGSGTLVFGIVVLGGLTRLTESGLSIVEWNLIKGMKPPRSSEEWEEEFDKYKQFPEYKILNHHMELEDFKNIFYMEWAHRMWGRGIGMAFLLPAAYYAYRGHLKGALGRRVLAIGGLIGFQGALGWYMVKSGLDEALGTTPNAVPRVSQYRLAAHLGSAFAIYAGMLYTGWDILRSRRAIPASSTTTVSAMKKVMALRTPATGLAALIFVTAMSGAFVAGLDAGLLYDTFPLMGDRLVPPKDEIWSENYTHEGSSLKWPNLFENPTTVQFNHRVLATTTFTGISALYFYARRLPLPVPARRAMQALMGVACLQVSLGIGTLIYGVPIALAAAHQAGSLVLLTAALRLTHTLKRFSKKG
ncbi:COX15/CtaA family [Piptocephalis cylindrospora]|uniref:COX15/CtaA family n=1 Tax=Piptocephalis cylindrospora TaxID=1907219 RepID=A0A4P9Y4E9_9FUNG|nr:COX15/CtaA family [Piptocephalis cylindrospora]|eukprot:RKP13785.1 COX15/CtaA family [Piptocephalis cylindrospora]